MSFFETWFPDSSTSAIADAPGASQTKPWKDKEADQKIRESLAVKKAFEDLVERNDSYKLACGEALEVVVPFLEKLKASLAKNSTEANVQFSKKCEAAIEKLSILRILVESTDIERTPTPKKVDIEKDQETILTTRLALLTQLQKLNALIADKFVAGDAKQLEQLPLKLSQYKDSFDSIVRDLQQPLRKMKDYLKSLKQSIDFLQANPIPQDNVGAIAQYMVFLNDPLIEGFNHDIKSQIGDLVNVMSIDVEHHIHLIGNKIKEWQKKYDEYTSIQIKIENVCRRIQWRLHMCQHIQTLKPEIYNISDFIKDMEKGIDTQMKLLKKDRENSLEGAKVEVEKFMGNYNTQTKALIEGINKQILAEKESLKDFQNLNLPAACDSIMSDFYFYDLEVCKSIREELATALAQSLKEITITLNEMEVQWDEEFKPFNEKVVGQLNVLASSVLTKNGEIRGGIWYAAKEAVGANTKRVALPNYEN